MFSAFPGPGIYQFRDSRGKWHLFGADWFRSNSEHVTLGCQRPRLSLVKA